MGRRDIETRGDMTDIFLHHNPDEQHNHRISCSLKNTLIIPIRMTLFNLACEPIMLSQKQRIQHGNLRHGIRSIPSKGKNSST